jgi:hypothetical protein
MWRYKATFWAIFEAFECAKGVLIHTPISGKVGYKSQKMSVLHAIMPYIIDYELVKVNYWQNILAT